TKLSAPITVPSGISLPGMTTAFDPAAVQLPNITSPAIRCSLIGPTPSGRIVTRSLAKSSLVHQILTPDDRLQKSPRANSRSTPPAIEQPDAMCEQRP